MNPSVIDNDIIRINTEPVDRSVVIERMREARLKPRSARRVDLVDRDTRLFNDRRWAEWDRQDEMIAAAAAAVVPPPAPRGWLRRLLGW